MDYSNINWMLLREQKLGLLEVLDELEDDLKYDTLTEEKDQHHIDCLRGILHLIDYVQDSAVDSGEYTEEEVFALHDVDCDTCDYEKQTFNNCEEQIAYCTARCGEGG